MNTKAKLTRTNWEKLHAKKKETKIKTLNMEKPGNKEATQQTT